MGKKPQITQIFTDSRMTKSNYEITVTIGSIFLSKFFNLRQSVKSVVDFPEVSNG